MDHATELLVAESLVKTATLAVLLKGQLETRYALRAAAKAVHVRQFEKVENSLADRLAPLFRNQISSAASKLAKIPSSKSVKTPDNATALTTLIFNPRDWKNELVNRALPPLAQGMFEAIASQLKLMERELASKGCSYIFAKSFKASTATEWLENNSDVGFEDTIFETPWGNVPMRVATEFPQWMKDSIEEQLKDTFAQDYWEEVNKTTFGDIEGYLRDGLKDGWSIDRMASAMKDHFAEGDYPLRRGRLIARTESGHALNGARSAAIDDFIKDVGDELPVKKSWLSVLGSTTRASHARINDVPADKEGKWTLGGVRCRWPSDSSLPAHERCNCQCTIQTEFGMDDVEAGTLIQEYDQRVQAALNGEEEKSFDTEKNCGTGAGGFKPGNSCGGSGGGGHGGGGGGGGGGGDRQERLRDRIEGTQAEADAEVKKTGKAVEQAKQAIETAKAAAQSSLAQTKVAVLTKTLDSTATRIADLKAKAEASKAKIAELKKQLKKSIEDDIETELDTVDKIIVKLRKAREQVEAITKAAKELA